MKLSKKRAAARGTLAARTAATENTTVACHNLRHGSLTPGADVLQPVGSPAIVAAGDWKPQAVMHPVQETSVPFDIDRKLTDAEIRETFKYCNHDVDHAMEVFLKRTEEFNTMMYFIKHFKLPIDFISKTKAQLAAEILGET